MSCAPGCRCGCATPFCACRDAGRAAASEAAAARAMSTLADPCPSCGHDRGLHMTHGCTTCTCALVSTAAGLVLTAS